MTAATLNQAAYAVDYDTPADEVLIDEYVAFATLSANLNINGDTASYLSSAKVTSLGTITVTHSLEKYSGWFWSWDTVSGSTDSKTKSNTSMISLSSSKSGLSNGKYRVKSVFAVTTNTGVTETVTIYSSEKTIS